MPSAATLPMKPPGGGNEKRWRGSGAGIRESEARRGAPARQGWKMYPFILSGEAGTVTAPPYLYIGGLKEFLTKKAQEEVEGSGAF